jgi:hypothetical protein
MVTLAFGTAAPEASVTVPMMVELTACENAELAPNAASRKQQKIKRRPCILTSSSN